MNLGKRTRAALATGLVGAGTALALLSTASPAVAFFSGGLFLDVTVQSPAHLVARGAAVNVPVQVTCNATQFASVSVQVTERVGKNLATGFGNAQVGCTGGHQNLVITVTAFGTRPFAKGTAFASADLFGCSSFCASEHGEATIDIRLPVRIRPVWELSSDFAVAPNQANPNPDQFGNPGVWQFLSATLDHAPANYQRLDEFITNRFGIAGLQGWQGSTVSGGELDKLPHVSLNTNSDNPLPVLGVDWPTGTVMVHPLPDRAAAVGWRSPINGHVSIAGGVVDRDMNCGDGIDWSIDRGATTLTRGAIPNGGAEAFAAGSGGAAGLLDVTVRKGDVLYFLVGPGPNGEYFCDSTSLDIIIERPKA